MKWVFICLYRLHFSFDSRLDDVATMKWIIASLGSTADEMRVRLHAGPEKTVPSMLIHPLIHAIFDPTR